MSRKGRGPRSDTGRSLTIQTPYETAKQPTDLISICQQDSLNIDGNQSYVPRDEKKRLQLPKRSMHDG